MISLHSSHLGTDHPRANSSTRLNLYNYIVRKGDRGVRRGEHLFCAGRELVRDWRTADTVPGAVWIQVQLQDGSWPLADPV